MLLHEGGTTQETHASFHVGKIKALKRLCSSTPPNWQGRSHISRTPKKGRQWSSTYTTGQPWHSVRALQVFATQLSSIWPRWGSSVPLSSLLSSHRLSSAEDLQSIAAHHYAIRVKHFHHLCFYSFMQNIYVRQYIFWTNIWKHHLKWDFLCIEEFVKITEKKKCEVPWLYTHYLYFINCLWHYHALYKAGMQLWSKPHKEKDFFACINLQTLTESEALLFCQLSP